MLLLPLLTLTGCKDSPPDHQLYLDQFRGAWDSSREGFETCLLIRSVEMRGECAGSTVAEAVRQGDEAAGSWCAEIPDVMWRSECWFTLAEVLAAQGKREAAAQACASSAELAHILKQNCLEHFDRYVPMEP